MIRACTHFRCTQAELESRFDAWELRRLELAEEECPWGERAENVRMKYLAAAMRMMWTTDESASTAAFNQMQAISILLFGPQKPAPPQRLGDVIPG